MLRFFTVLIFTVFLAISFNSCRKLQNFIPEDLAKQAIMQTLEYSADTADEQSQNDVLMNASASTKIAFPQSDLISVSVLNKFPTGTAALTVVETSINTESNKLSKDLNVFIDDATIELIFDDVYNMVYTDDAVATAYLNEQKSEQLKRDFTTYLAQKIRGSQLESSIIDFQNSYNAYNGAVVLNQDPASYLAEKIIERYFYLMSLEEVKIRTDKSHQRSDVLQQVFGDN
jgi:hypothetical protein